MTPEIQALRERFRDQMPGLVEFDELAGKYERLLTAQQDLERRWLKSGPVVLQELRSTLQEIAATEGLAPAIKQKLLDAMKGAKS